MILLDEDFTKYGSFTLNDEIWDKIVGGKGFGNKEEQYYTLRDKNCFVDQEGLHIRAIKEDYRNCHYTSSRIMTKMTFGNFHLEVCCKLPSSIGAWPAIWMLGEDIKTLHNWPECGEIDLVESVGRMENIVHFSLHSKDHNHVKRNHQTKQVYVDKLGSLFYKYDIYKVENKISFFINGKKECEFTKDDFDEGASYPFNGRFYLICNLALGGTFGGPIDENFKKDEMIIKYIKITDEVNHEI